MNFFSEHPEINSIIYNFKPSMFFLNTPISFLFNNRPNSQGMLHGKENTLYPGEETDGLNQ